MLIYILTLAALVISGCNNSQYSKRDGAPGVYVHAIHAPNPKPRFEKKSKYGNNRTYHVKGKKYHVLKTANNYHKIGIASWYGTKFHGRLTSSREPYNMFALTAASKELPIPCYVKVKNLSNHKEVIVRVNDRGPFKPGRIMDLSYAAAQKIGMLKRGTARVEITHISPNTKHHKKTTTGSKSLLIGIYKNKTSALKIKNKLMQHKEFKKIFLIPVNEYVHLIVGPLNKRELRIAKNLARKMQLKVKIV